MSDHRPEVEIEEPRSSLFYAHCSLCKLRLAPETWTASGPTLFTTRVLQWRALAQADRMAATLHPWGKWPQGTTSPAPSWITSWSSTDRSCPAAGGSDAMVVCLSLATRGRF